MSEDVKELENETPAEAPEVEAEMPEETSTDTVLTEDDYYREKARADEAEKKAATALAQKEHYRKKAEEKKLAPQVETPQASINQLTRDEVFLIAKGVSEEVINEARFRAEAKGISLKEAMEDPVVITLQKEVEARERRSKAQLPPSSGGTSVRGVDLINAVGMSEEEHRKAIGM